MESKAQKIITRKTLKTQIALLKLNTSLKDEEKFIAILNGCDEELGKAIVKQGVTTWNLLQNLIPTKNELGDKMIDIILSKPSLKETKLEYITRIFEELENFGCSENKIVKLLSEKLWPSNPIRTLELSRNTTLKDLQQHIQLLTSLDANKKEKNKLICKKCNKSGHKEAYCTVKN